MDFRFATTTDASLLAQMNQQLIIDEEHRNPMTLAELERRMSDWLAEGRYEAVLFEHEGAMAGYALFRREPDHIYLRQLFVVREMRRRGLGREAMAWLRQHAWAGANRIRIEVLVGNSAGIAFWRAVGLQDYCVTMEMTL